MMTLLTVSTMGGVLFAYRQEAPSIAVAISFLTLVLNFTMSAHAGYIPFNMKDRTYWLK